jgi:hypothetical protein
MELELEDVSSSVAPISSADEMASEPYVPPSKCGGVDISDDVARGLFLKPFQLFGNGSIAFLAERCAEYSESLRTSASSSLSIATKSRFSMTRTVLDLCLSREKGYEGPMPSVANPEGRCGHSYVNVPITEHDPERRERYFEENRERLSKESLENYDYDNATPAVVVFEECSNGFPIDFKFKTNDENIVIFPSECKGVKAQSSVSAYAFSVALGFSRELLPSKLGTIGIPMGTWEMPMAFCSSKSCLFEPCFVLSKTKYAAGQTPFEALLLTRNEDLLTLEPGSSIERIFRIDKSESSRADASRNGGNRRVASFPVEASFVDVPHKRSKCYGGFFEPAIVGVVYKDFESRATDVLRRRPEYSRSAVGMEYWAGALNFEPYEKLLEVDPEDTLEKFRDGFLNRECAFEGYVKVTETCYPKNAREDPFFVYGFR